VQYAWANKDEGIYTASQMQSSESDCQRAQKNRNFPANAGTSAVCERDRLIIPTPAVINVLAVSTNLQHKITVFWTEYS